MSDDANSKGVINILKCVKCHYSDFVVKKNSTFNLDDYVFNSEGRCFECNKCGNIYPITDDDIPILWTPELKGMLRKDSNNNPIGSLFANINHYNRISDDYSINFRRDNLYAERVKNGAEKLLKTNFHKKNNATSDNYHLDIGCGPGHVLEWLNGATNKQVGLDVSLTNLRNARKNTGAYVVLGDATNIPFKDGVFSLVSEASALHHILDWKKVILESCRVCSKTNGGILFDSEPTSESLSFSLLARLVFEMRWPVYKLLSYFNPKKIHFRSIALAREYYKNAEIHNQPDRGFSTIEVEGLFNSAGFSAEIFLSPDEYLHKRQSISFQEADWQRLVMHLLSGHNPFLAKYGSFTTLALPNKNQKIPENGN
jgi:ubiquinone/menaquinone biosynthesis C-methylase UbiE